MLLLTLSLTSAEVGDDFLCWFFVVVVHSFCLQGRSDVQTTPRVNNGTVCIIDTEKLKIAERVLIQRGYLAAVVNGHPADDGVWGASSQDALNRWMQVGLVSCGVEKDADGKKKTNR